MEFGRAFTFAFEDQDWVKKLGIAGLLLIIPILGILVVAGWALEVTRRVIHREAELLPDWGNFGDYLVKGLMLWVVGFVYSLPVVLVSACQQGAMIYMQDSSADETMVTAITVLSICFSCIIFLYSIFIGFVLPAAFAKLAVTGQIGAAFRFGEVFGMVRAAPSAYLIVLLGSIVAGLVGSLGIILCVIGVVFTYAYAMVVNAHLWGQAYNVATGGPSTQSAF
jgi:hypothetical protein